MVTITGALCSDFQVLQILVCIYKIAVGGSVAQRSYVTFLQPQSWKGAEWTHRYL